MARPNEATLFIFVLATILQNEIPTRTITASRLPLASVRGVAHNPNNPYCFGCVV